MTWLSRLFRRGKLEMQLDSELRFHVEQQIADNVAAGMSPAEARRRALAQFGGVEYVKEETPRGPWHAFHRNVAARFTLTRFGCSANRRGFTAVAVLTLALGIGANTAIFSLIDAVMLRMLPVQNPEQLVRIRFRSPVSPRPRAVATNPIWEQVRDHQDAFSGVIAWSPEMFDLADGGEQNDINGIYASGDYFTVLGVRPAAGRLLAPSDDVRNCSGVAVLSYGFWQSHYAGAESAVGSPIRLNGHAFPIVGVAQRGFFGTDVGEKLDVAIPICAEATLVGKDSALNVRDDWWLMMMGRLKPGTSVEQADARMKVLSPPLFGAVVPQDWPAKYQDVFRKYAFGIFPGATGTSGFHGVRQQYSQPLEILMFVVGLVSANRVCQYRKSIAGALGGSSEGNCGTAVAGRIARTPDSSGAHGKRRAFRRRRDSWRFLCAMGQRAARPFRFHAAEPGLSRPENGRPHTCLHHRHRRALRRALWNLARAPLHSCRRHVRDERRPVANLRRTLPLLCRALDCGCASRALAHSPHRHGPFHSHLRESHDSPTRASTATMFLWSKRTFTTRESPNLLAPLYTAKCWRNCECSPVSCRRASVG